MKTTIYELLGMVKDNKTPKRILFRNQVYKYEEEAKDYYNVEYGYIFDEWDIVSILNESVEILETTITYKPDKIEKIDMFDYFTGYWYEELPEDFKKHLETNFETLNSKINEIIDRLNNL